MSDTARRKANRPAAENTPLPEQVRIVRRYLSTLDAQRPGRGPKRAAEAIANRLLKIDELLISADPISRLHLTQERIDLDAESIRLGNGNEADLGELEVEFVRVAKPYGDRHGVTYSAWRQVGVEADVLERAGIVRVRKPAPVPTQTELKLDAPKPQPAAKEQAPPKEQAAPKEQPAPAKKPQAKKAAGPAKKAAPATKKATAGAKKA
jgi:hypothetical protein